MILPVILQEGNITNTENNQIMFYLVWLSGGIVVWFLFSIILHKVSANLKFIYIIFIKFKFDSVEIFSCLFFFFHENLATIFFVLE